MVSPEFTQADAERLLAMEKFRIDETNHKFPDRGGKLSINLVNKKEKENFVINYNRGTINLQKRSHNMRGYIVLARLDLDGSTHRNPDGQEVPARHLHLYREGYGDKWAFPVPENFFCKMDDAYQTLQDFMNYCNVVELPNIERSLFS
jgi:hypothetical protein